MNFARWIWVLACTTGLAVGQVDRVPRTDVTPSRLELRIDPLADLYHWVRSLAVSDQPLPQRDGLPELVARVRESSRSLGHPLLWGALDAELEGCRTAGDLLKRFREGPEEQRAFGQVIPLRAIGVTIAEGLVPLEASFLADLWPERRAALLERKAQLDAGLIAHFDDCLQLVLESFGVVDPQETVPVYLVTQSPPPGGVTYYRRTGKGGVCFVDIEHNAGGQLVETVLHEALHALEAAGGSDGDGATADLRRRLLACELPPRDPRLRNLPHLLLFVQAGETVRRRLDPEHRHYGEVSGAYGRFGADATIVREEWIAFLDGKKTREDALAAIARRATER